MALTAKEKEILRLSTYGFSDYRIGRKTKTHPNSVVRSHRAAIKKIALAQADLAYVEQLKARAENNERILASTNLRFGPKIKF